MAYSWGRISMTRGKEISEVSPLSTAFPPCECHPHSCLRVAAGEQRGTTANKKVSRHLPSYFLGAGPQIGSRNPEPALPAAHSPDSLHGSVSLSLIVTGWTRRPLRAPPPRLPPSES